MTDLSRTRIAAPKMEARLAGAAYLYIVAAGIFAEAFVRAALVAPGDAAATMTNILGADQVYRLAFVAELLLLACDIIVAVLLYRVLKPTGDSLALLAAAFRLVMAAMLGVNALNHLAPLTLVGGAPGLSALSEAQLQDLGYLSLRAHASLYSAGLVFFGFACAFLGVSILRSRFLPKVLGVLMVIAGACYLLNSLAGFLAPRFAGVLFPYILLPCLVAELTLSLWLLTMGINSDRWSAQAREPK